VDHQRISLDPNARNARHTYAAPSENGRTLRVQQMLVDPEEHNDWLAEFEVDLAESRQIGEPRCGCGGSGGWGKLKQDFDHGLRPMNTD